jgi:hypothetical protein
LRDVRANLDAALARRVAQPQRILGPQSELYLLRRAACLGTRRRRGLVAGTRNYILSIT